MNEVIWVFDQSKGWSRLELTAERRSGKYEGGDEFLDTSADESIVVDIYQSIGAEADGLPEWEIAFRRPDVNPDIRVFATDLPSMLVLRERFVALARDLFILSQGSEASFVRRSTGTPASQGLM